jgi:hypothetical protein
VDNFVGNFAIRLWTNLFNKTMAFGRWDC